MCTLYRENLHHFTSLSDLPFFWTYIFSAIEPLYPYALGPLRRDTEVLRSVSEIVKFCFDQKQIELHA